MVIMTESKACPCVSLGIKKMRTNVTKYINDSKIRGIHGSILLRAMNRSGETKLKALAIELPMAKLIALTSVPNVSEQYGWRTSKLAIAIPHTAPSR